MLIDRIKELDVFNTAQQRLPGEQLAPIVNQDPQGSSCNDRDIAEAEANSFIQQGLQHIEGMKKPLQKAGDENALKLLEDFRKLFASCYSLPEMEERMVATYGARVVVFVRKLFDVIVKGTGGDEYGGAAYERHSLECASQRRESRDKEESEQRRRSEEEESEQRKLANYTASASGRK